MMDLNQLGKIIGNFVAGTMATVDESNAPDVRGWELQFIHDNKFYFTTANTKRAYRQMKANPNVAFYCSSNGYFVRVRGKIQFVEDPSIIRYVFENMDDNVKQMYPQIDSNGFTVICLEHGEVEYAEGFAPFTTIKF